VRFPYFEVRFPYFEVRFPYIEVRFPYPALSYAKMRFSHFGTGKRDTLHTGPSAAFKIECKFQANSSF